MTTKTITLEIPGDEENSPQFLLSVKQAARALNLSPAYIFLLIKSGQLLSIKVGKRRLIPIHELHSFIARGGRTQQ